MSATVTRVGRISHLDRSTLLKLQAGCNYINAEIQKQRGRLVWLGLVAGVVGLILYAFSWEQGNRDPRWPIGGPLILFGLYVVRVRKQLSKSYKHIVIGRVVSALGQGLKYTSHSMFTLDDFRGMDLFDKRAEQWSAEDEVSGRKNAVTYCVLEAEATRKEGSGKRRRTVTIFKGLIVRLDFNKNFQGHTVVVADASAPGLLSGIFGESTSRRQKEICRMEDVEFEKQFSVYSTNQQEARYILTPKLMELIMEARAMLGADIRLSFHDNSVFMTIPQSVDRFEVALFGAQVTPETAVGELAEVIRLAERLVDTLELETRIWSRV